MSVATRILLGLGLLAFVTACAPKVEEVVVVPEPITTEPTNTGIYK
jgi:hypothetical protein